VEANQVGFFPKLFSDLSGERSVPAAPTGYPADRTPAEGSSGK